MAPEGPRVVPTDPSSSRTSIHVVYNFYVRAVQAPYVHEAIHKRIKDNFSFSNKSRTTLAVWPVSVLYAGDWLLEPLAWEPAYFPRELSTITDGRSNTR